MADEQFQRTFDRLMDTGDWKAALDFAARAVEHDPENGFYREHLGIALWSSGNKVESKSQLLRASRTHRLSEVADLILIQCLMALGQRREAIARLRTFLHTREIARKTLEKLASIFGKVGEFRFALEVCQHLVSVYPESADAWYGLGFYQERLGCPPEITVTAMRRAVLLSRSICARVHLAKLLSQLESWREAYVLVANIPVPMLNRFCWAHTVFQVALANQDFQKAELVRKTWLTSDALENLLAEPDDDRLFESSESP